MAGKDLNKELNELIQSCKKEGILGDMVDGLINMQDKHEPKIVSVLIEMFIDGADDDIANITEILSKSKVNYAQVICHAESVTGANLTIGNDGVHTASLELVAAAEAKNKAECLENLEVLKSEYLILKEKLTQIAEIKNAIIEKSKNDKKV